MLQSRNGYRRPQGFLEKRGIGRRGSSGERNLNNKEGESAPLILLRYATEDIFLGSMSARCNRKPRGHGLICGRMG
jgi:hypothetical protein